MGSSAKFFIVANLILLCSGYMASNMTAEFRAMNWTQLRDYVFNNVPTTTESVGHHYVQKVAHDMEELEGKVGTAVKKEVSIITDGATDLLYKCLIGAGIVIAVMTCGGCHLCCTIYRTERETQKNLKRVQKAKNEEYTCV